MFTGGLRCVLLCVAMVKKFVVKVHRNFLKIGIVFFLHKIKYDVYAVVPAAYGVRFEGSVFVGQTGAVFNFFFVTDKVVDQILF